MRKITVSIMAHVDAGKTTLSEAMLFVSGRIRKLGRVDKRDAFLDTYELERQRGITIFSKQAEAAWKDLGITLLDTPGHVDFSAETERTLQVLDYAVLVISGADKVQGHTETLWRLLQKHRIPVFLFVNKMDQPGTDREEILKDIRARLTSQAVAFDGSRDEQFYEELAVCEETLLEDYLEQGIIEDKEIRRLVGERRVFPVYFGSALKVEGVEALLEGLRQYTEPKVYPETFGARVYKISRDAQGNRLTHLKLTGGVLKVKDVLKIKADTEEKVNQIRIYSGEKYELLQEVPSGTVCAVTGLSGTRAGQGLGIEKDAWRPELGPVLTYGLKLPEGCNVHETLRRLMELSEEEPELHIVWSEEQQEIQVQLMGEVQIEVLKELIRERYGIEAAFGSGKIVYRETIKNTVEGVGHYEPLRHYAEVHLLMEPGAPGSGLVFDTDCSEDLLDKNWQRLILTHLEEKQHRGVLTGSEITDMKLTVIGGRAHLKHTEGGDFRESTYRAVRQGLMEAESILLEPFYEFRLEIPAEYTGRALSDIERMQGSCQYQEMSGDTTVLSGKAPVSAMGEYPKELIAYSRGRGKISMKLLDYEPCHNAGEVISAISYDPERDKENPTGSVFCAHGAGFVVPWNEVKGQMHVEAQYQKPSAKAADSEKVKPGKSFSYTRIDDKELEAIFAKTYGTSKRENDRLAPRRVSDYSAAPAGKKKKEPLTEYLLVDGYNVIFAWEDLKELAGVSIEAARGRLADILCNYQGYRGCTLILVFDAYKVVGNPGELLDYHNIHIVYTKEAETADQYIEKLAHEIGRKYHVTVATSDGLEQLIIRGQGCHLMSSGELREEIERMSEEIRKEYVEHGGTSDRNYLFDHMEEELASYMEEIRLGKNIKP